MLIPLRYCWTDMVLFAKYVEDCPTVWYEWVLKIGDGAELIEALQNLE